MLKELVDYLPYYENIVKNVDKSSFNWNTDLYKKEADAFTFIETVKNFKAKKDGLEKLPHSDKKQESFDLLKQFNHKYATYLWNLGIYDFNVLQCGTHLEYLTNGTDSKLKSAWFCKDRLCPICAKLKANLLRKRLTELVKLVKNDQPKGKFVFLTLTEKNSTADELKSNIQKMNRSVYRLFQYAEIKKVVLGTVRTTEVTFNKKDNTFHQHMHILIMVKSSYFSHNCIRQPKWAMYWQRARKLDYTPIINIQAIKPNRRKGLSDIDSAILEVAKYQVKSADYMQNSDEQNMFVIKTLRTALKGMRAIGLSGIFKQFDAKAKTELENLEKAKNADLIGQADGLTGKLELAIFRYNFKKQKYYLIQHCNWTPPPEN